MRKKERGRFGRDDRVFWARRVRQIQAKQEEARKPVRRGAGTAVPCPYMGGLIVGPLVRTF